LYPSWALICAADCLTGLKRFEEAEQYLKANANRYGPIGRYTFHVWREQTGQGNLPNERQNILTYVAMNPGKFGGGLAAEFYLIVGEKDKALQKCRQQLVQVSDARLAWMTALLFDEQKDAKNRDISLKLVTDASLQPNFERQGLSDLAKLCQEALQDPANLNALPKRVEELLATIEDPRRHCETTYYAARFLELHGKEAEGQVLLKRVAEFPCVLTEAALAVKELRDRKAANDNEKK
jgi:hypothetical protein